MTHRINIISGGNIPLPSSEKLPNSYVEVIGHGAGIYYLGKSKCQKSTITPHWEFEIKFPFFRALELEIIVMHQKTLGKDIHLCSFKIDLRGLPSGNETTVVDQSNSLLVTKPSLTLRYDRFAYPSFPTVAPKKYSSYIVYATYSPPMNVDAIPSQMPVEIRALNFAKNGANVVSLDSNSYWQYLGGSTGNKAMLGPSGWTQVHRIHKNYVSLTCSTFYIVPHQYTGTVTVHVLGCDDDDPILTLEPSAPHDDHVSELKQVNLNVANVGVCQSVNFYFDNCSDKGDIQSCSMTASGQESIEKFEERVVVGITKSQDEFRRRNIPHDISSPFHEKYTIPDIVDISTASNQLRKGNPDGFMIRTAYDNKGKEIGSIEDSKSGFIKELSRKMTYSRFHDGHHYEFNLSKASKSIKFITIVVKSCARMNYCVYEQKCLKIWQINAEAEIAFIPLVGDGDEKTRACAVCVLTLGEDGWEAIPILKFAENEDKAQKIALRCSMEMLGLNH